MRVLGPAVALCLYLAVPHGVSVTAAVDGVASQESRLNDAFPLLPTTDLRTMTFGTDAGDVVVISQEGFAVYARTSGDGGQTFGPEVLVAGPPVSERVRAMNASMGSDGSLFVLLEAESPGGGPHVLVRSSPDVGLTWNALATVTPDDDPAETSRVSYSGIEAGTAGVAAVALDGWENSNYVAVTTDYGATWTTPKRLNVVEGNCESAAVVVDDANGDVFAAYDEYDASSGEQWIYVTRSTDGGQTFGNAVSLQSLVPSPSVSVAPQVAIASDGSVLLTWMVFDYASGVDRILVARSVDRGVSFAKVMDETLSGGPGSHYLDTFPYLWTAASDSNVFVSWVEIDFSLHVARSTDSGAVFGTSVVVAGSGVRPDSQQFAGHQIRRAATGRWAVAYGRDPDPSDAIGAQVFTKVFASGAWGSEYPVSNMPAGLPDATSIGLAMPGADGLFAIWLDARQQGGLVADVYSDRTITASPSFGPDVRVDDDHDFMNAGFADVPGSIRIYSDGASHAYALLVTAADGTGRNLWLRRSVDGGHSWEAPVRLNNDPGADVPIEIETGRGVPAIAAVADGFVYAIWTVTEPVSGDRQVRFNRSDDFGATWSTEDTVLAILASSTLETSEDPDIAASTGGRVYVTWSSGGEVSLARSTDGGLNFVTSAVASMGASSAFVCASADDVVVAWDDAGEVAGRYSANSAVSFDTAVTLESGVGTSIVPPKPGALDCAGGGRAADVWWSRDRVSRVYSLFATRLEAGTWQLPEVHVMDISTVYNAEIAYTDAVGSLVVAARGNGGDGAVGIWTVRSSDAGVNYGAPIRLDSDGDRFAARLLATDRSGAVWVAWNEVQSPRTSGSTVFSRSIDSGATFDPPRRMYSDATPGFLFNVRADVAALDRTGLFVWSGARQSPLYDPMFNADDLDDPDLDGFEGVLDCAPNDGTVYPGAPEVNDGLDNQCPGDPGYGVVDELSATTGFTDGGNKNAYCWAPQAGATEYEALRSDDPGLGSNCATTTTTDLCWNDATEPSPGAALFYVARPSAPNAGSWGQASDSSERVSACP